MFTATFYDKNLCVCRNYRMAVGTSEDDCCHSQTKRQVHLQQPGDDYLQAEQTCQDTDDFHSLFQM